MKIYISILFMIFSGCEFFGTHTGNPGDPPKSNDVPARVQPNPVNEVVDADLGELVCSLINGCNSSVNLGDCRASVRQSENFVTALGFLSQEYPTYQDLVEANPLVDTESYESCVSALSELNCTDSEMIASYSAGVLDPFANLHLVFGASESCSQIGVSAAQDSKSYHFHGLINQDPGGVL